MSRCHAAVLLTIIFLARGATAGTVFEFATTEYEAGGEPILGTVQMSTDGPNTRLEIISVTSAEAGGLIFLGEAKELIILDHSNASYITLDQSQMNAMAAQVGDAMSAMEEQLATLPPEQRALAEQMMQGQFGQTAEPEAEVVNPLGSHGTVADIPCRTYEVLRGERKFRELCVSDWDDLEGGQETAAALRGVSGFFEEMRQAFAGTGGMEVFDRQQELFGLMGELDGYPVLHRDFDASGSMTRETRLTAARQQELSAGFFSPPESYTLQEMPVELN